MNYKLETRDMFFLLTLFVIIAAMFTKQPTLDDAAKITLGAFLQYLNQKPGA